MGVDRDRAIAARINEGVGFRRIRCHLGEIALAESLLQGAEIPYVVQNATGQTLVGAVARESMFASVEVKPEHADAAAELLADLNEGIPADDIDEYYEDDDDDDDFDDEEDGDEKFTEASEDE